MEALIGLAALALLGVLAVRFGSESRPSLHTKRQDWTATRTTRTDEPLTPVSHADRVERTWSGVEDTGMAPARYPVLAFIDRALGPAGPGFATAADAAQLERRARDVTDAYWGESVWLTGCVSAATLRVVCDLLERGRTPTIEPARTAALAVPTVQSPFAIGSPGPLPSHQPVPRDECAQPRPPLSVVTPLPPSAVPA